MRVAGNKLKHIHDFFRTELKDSYAASEIEALFAAAAEHVLGFSKTDLVLNAEKNINQSDLLKLYNCVKDLKKNIPLQYVLGESWFYGLKFRVSQSVLIPRPETEELVELVLKENKSVASILDVGTGSGCIPVSLKKHLPAAEVSACDISQDALDVAKTNAAENNTTVRFFEIDILERQLPQKFELIISNPPYIKESEKQQMEKNVLEHEPHSALFVEGDDAIIFYKKIIDLCASSLHKKGRLYFELNPLTAVEVNDYAKKAGIFEQTFLIKDMSGALRFFKATKN